MAGLSYVHIVQFVFVVAPYGIIEVIARSYNPDCLAGIIFVKFACFGISQQK